MPNDRRPFLYAGLGLAGVAAFQLLQKPATAPTPTPIPTPAGTRSFPDWLGDCRSDVVAGLQQGRYRDVIGQYAREATPGFWTRSDILAGLAIGAWDDVVGQWLRENAGGFMNRSDIVAGLQQGRKGDVFGQFCRENGATRCVPNLPAPTQGNPARNVAGQGPGGSPGTGRNPVPTLPPTGKPALNSLSQIRQRMIIATGCSWSDANYIVLSRRSTATITPPFGRVWIKDKWTWDGLQCPRSAINIVTRGLLFQMPDAGTLRRTIVRNYGEAWIWDGIDSTLWDTAEQGLNRGPFVILKNPAGWC